MQIEEREEFPRRKRNRLPNFDYSSNGAYFVTICVEGRKKALSDIAGDGPPVLKRPGMIAEDYIRNIPAKYPCVKVDKYVVMPNHIHLLLFIERGNGTGNPSPTLGNIIGWYKYNVTKQIHGETGFTNSRFFQRSYHDHVIRGEKDYLEIWEYISIITPSDG